MVNSLQKERIQNALVELGRAASYPPVSYNPETGEASADLNTSIAPATALANEVSVRFAPARENRRSFKREIIDWRFDLHLEWNQEITLEPFFEQISDEPPILPRDDANDLKQVTLLLVGGDVRHPAQQESLRGTRSRIGFIAEIQPK